MVTAEERPKPVVLCLLDGIGHKDAPEQSAAKTPALDALRERFGGTNLEASGEAVGLGEGSKGSGALGHEAIGTGRTPSPASRRVDAAIAAKKFAENEVLRRAMWIVNDRSCRLHVFMPLDETGAHASMSHLRALFNVADAYSAKLVVHAFLMGKPGAPRSAWKQLEGLGVLLEGRGTIGTISGGMYALDRTGRWDLVQKAYTAIVRGDAKQKPTTYDALQDAYEKVKSDFAIEPVRIGDYDGMKGSFMADFSSGSPAWTWFGEEAGLVMALRPDRIHALTAMFTRTRIPAEVEEFLTERGKAIYAFDEFGLLSLTEIDPAFEKVLAAFPNESVEGSLADALAGAGLKLARFAGADRERHVTRFFDGKHAEKRAGEEIVTGPDEEDEESTIAAAEKAIEGGTHDVILVDLRGAGRAARRGEAQKARAAIEAIDAAIGRIAAKTEARGGALFVVGTHGAAEDLLDEEGKIRGENTANPVPFVYANPRDAAKIASSGRLADVAPTILDVLGVKAPERMTGRSLRAPR